MEVVTLCISIVSLIIASIAYYRTGGEREIRALEHRIIEMIRDLQSVSKAARSLTVNHVESVTAVQKQAQELLLAIRAKAIPTRSEQLDSDLPELA